MGEGGLNEQEKDWLLHQEHASASFTGVGQTPESLPERLTFHRLMRDGI